MAAILPAQSLKIDVESSVFRRNSDTLSFMRLRHLPSFSWAVVGLLSGGVLLSFLWASPYPLDDHFFYQSFVEALAAGKLDLTIQGFHGSDFFAAIWHLVSRSPISQIEFQIFSAVLVPLCAFLAGRTLYKSDSEALLLSGVFAMMPFILFVGLRGWTGPSYMCLMLLSIACARRFPVVSGLLLAFAILTKPFAIALLPLLLVLDPSGKKWFRRTSFLCAIGIPVLYGVLQYLQAGQLLVGSHSGFNQFTVWQGPIRIVLNLAHSLQILFSVHNYYFVDPALTGPGNMMHTTPVLVFLGLFALLSKGTSDQPVSVRKALLLGAVIGIGLNALLDHMDHFYMQAGILCLILAAIPLLKKYPLWILFVLATLHFQWFYFYLEYREVFQLGTPFFLVPLLTDVVFFLWCLLHWREAVSVSRVFNDK